MVNSLLELRGKLKLIYARYGEYLDIIFKFLLAVIVFKEINHVLPFVENLDQGFFIVVAALICSIMPLNLLLIGGMVLVVGQCYGIGLEVAGFAVALLLLMWILYIRFTPKDTLVLLLTPLAFSMGIPSVIPIAYGLVGTPASSLAAGFGVVLYAFMNLVASHASVMQGAGKEEMLQNLKFLLDGMLQNQEMWITVIAFVTVLLIVSLVRHLEVEYAWHLAIFGGGIAYLVIMTVGSIFLEAQIPVIPLIAGTIASVILGMILEFFFFHVDYKKTERLQFEDDEYYYYVKAVPKICGEKEKAILDSAFEEEEGEVMEDAADMAIENIEKNTEAMIREMTEEMTGDFLIRNEQERK